MLSNSDRAENIVVSLGKLRRKINFSSMHSRSPSMCAVMGTVSALPFFSLLTALLPAVSFSC